MKLKKIMAGALILALNTPAATAVRAENSGDYLYYEDFETADYDERLDVQPKVIVNGYEIKNSRTEKNGNAVMEYYREKSAGTAMMVGTWLKFLPNISLEENKVYEVGFSINPVTDRSDFVCAWNADKFNLNVTGTNTPNLLSEDGSLGSSSAGTTPSGSLKIFGEQISNRENKEDYAYDGFIDFRIRFNTTTGEGLQRIFRTLKSTGEEEKFERNITFNVADGQYINSVEGITATIKMTSSSYVREDGFYLDNLYVKELKTYNVTFDKNDGSGDTLVNQTDYDGITSIPDVARDDYVFGGWYTDTGFQTEFINKNIDSDITVYAKWIKIHHITFNSMGGSEVAESTTTTGEIILPEPPVNENHYAFGGWFKEPECKNEFFGTGITSDMTVYAKWIPTYKITFETNGGDPIDPVYTISGLSDGETLPEPEYIGYRFDGWFSENDEPFDGHSVSGDVTAYAKWTKKYKITFETNGGDPVEPVYTLEDLTSLPTTIKGGVVLEGWYKNKELTQLFDGTGITGDMTVYAKFNDIVFSEDFESGGGTDWIDQLVTKPENEKYKSEYGVVQYLNGNHVFRVASDGRNSLVVTFPEAGEGMYEISFKARCRSGGFYVQNLVTPLYIKDGVVKEVVSAGCNAGNFYINGNALANTLNLAMTDRLQMDDFDFVSVKYVVDTRRKVASLNASYTDRFGNVYFEEAGGIDVTSDAPAINGLMICKYVVGSFTGRDVFFDDFLVRKIDNLPKVESITPEEGATGVSVKPEIQIKFSERMDSTTINSESVRIEDSNGNPIDSEKYRISSKNVGGKTVSTIEFLEELSRNTKYTIKTTSMITNGEYYLYDNYSSSFTTAKNEIQPEVRVTDAETGEEISDLKAYAGKTVNVSVDIYTVSAMKCFVSAALTDETNGRQMTFAFSESALTDGENTGVLNTALRLPDIVTDSYKIRFYTWNDRLSRKQLAESLVYPK